MKSPAELKDGGLDGKKATELQRANATGYSFASQFPGFHKKIPGRARSLALGK